MAMRLPEQRLWDKMRTALRGKAYLERVENLMNEGTPDVLCSTPGAGACWVELKARDVMPVRDNSMVLGAHGLNPSQRNWHLDWRRAGGRSWILVGLEQSEFLLIPGALHDTVNAMTRSEMRQHAAASGWLQIAEILNGKES